jgi:hypothetical protein
VQRCEAGVTVDEPHMGEGEGNPGQWRLPQKERRLAPPRAGGSEPNAKSADWKEGLERTSGQGHEYKWESECQNDLN